MFSVVFGAVWQVCVDEEGQQVVWKQVRSIADYKARVLFGAADVDALLTLRFDNVEASYRADTGHLLPRLAADVFLVRDERLRDNAFDFDALLVHELAHPLDDPDTKPWRTIAIEYVDSVLALRLRNLRPDDDYHTKQFFEFFVVGCHRLGMLSDRHPLNAISAGLRFESWRNDDYVAEAWPASLS